MAVIECNEKMGESGSDDVGSGRDITRTFVIVTDSRDDGIQVVGGHPGLPRFGDPYVKGVQIDLNSRVKRNNPRQIAPKLWEVDITYSSTKIDPDEVEADPQEPDDPSDDNGQLPPDPLDRREYYSYDEVEVEEALWQDFNSDPAINGGNPRPIVNTCGQPLDPPLTYSRSLLQINIRCNKYTYDEVFARFAKNRVNQDVWRGYPVNSLLVREYSGESDYFNNVRYWKHNITLLYDNESWIPKRFLNVGYYSFELKDPDDVSENPPVHTVKARDAFGAPLGAQVPLDANGRRLSEADIQARNFHYLEFTLYRRALFAGKIP